MNKSKILDCNLDVIYEKDKITIEGKEDLFSGEVVLKNGEFVVVEEGTGIEINLYQEKFKWKKISCRKI